MNNHSMKDAFSLWRLFFIESSRNSKLIDGIGFFHAVMPLLMRSRTGEGGRNKIDRGSAARNLGYFNCNPMLAPFVIARVGALENAIAERTDDALANESASNYSKTPEDDKSLPIDRVDRASLQRGSYEKVVRYKDSLSSSLTSVGDYFCEIVLVPLSLTIGTILALLGSYIGAILFLAVYNFYHLRLRIGAFYMGFEGVGGSGKDVLQKLVGEHRFLEGLLAFTVGVFSAIVFVRGYNAGGNRFAIVGLITVALVLLLRKKLSFTFTIILLFLALSTYLVV